MADTSNAARTPYAPEDPKPNFLSNILAIIGFIILIVVVIWGLVHLASLSRGWFSSLFGESSAAIEVNAPGSAMSGTAFDVTWKYNEPTGGSYAFLYPCQSGFQFQTPGASGAMNGIPCGAAFSLADETNNISLTPYLTGSETVAVPLSIIFMPTATGTEAQGSATVTVAPSSAPAPAPAPTPTPTPSPTPSYSSSTYSSGTSATYSPSTPADLSVRIISATVDAGGNGTVVFDITNVGGSSSGTYYFTANLPTVTGYAYVSPAQTFMTAGARVRNTLRFSDARSGVATVSITTPDVNGANNHASQVVSGDYYNYNYDQYGVYPAYQYTYPTYQQSPYMYQPYPYSTYYPYSY